MRQYSSARRGTAAAAVIVLLAACSRGGSTNSANGSLAADTVALDSAGLVGGSPPARPLRLSAADGNVTLQPQGASTWTAPSVNSTLSTGDRLATGSNGRAELDLGTAAVRVDRDADATVRALGDNYTQLGVNQGALDASLYQYDPTDSIEIDTPNGAFVPTSAGTYLLSVDPTTNSTLVDVIQGALSLIAPSLSRSIGAGQLMRLVGSNPVQLVPVSEPVSVFTPLQRWQALRDARWQRSGPVAQYVSESVPGWEDLDDSGQWTVDQANTPVWCPTTSTSSQYVPYRSGHWTYVRPWGWTWVDDAPWGYTTSHYGRWEQITTSSCQSSNNWAWVPAPTVAQPVYAPALVAFVDAAQLAANAVGGNTAPAQAWFPLGPEEAYLPPYPHTDEYVQTINITNLRKVRDVAPLIRAGGPPGGRWANRVAALTAVPVTVFSAGGPVRTHLMRVAPARTAAIPVAWRPAARPMPRAVIRGRPAARPPHIVETPRTLLTGAFGHGNPRENAHDNARDNARDNSRGAQHGQASGELAPRIMRAMPHAVAPQMNVPAPRAQPAPQRAEHAQPAPHPAPPVAHGAPPAHAGPPAGRGGPPGGDHGGGKPDGGKGHGRGPGGGDGPQS